ncbi:uncharacterized protein LOC126213297 [Schistocerca nitens]|uniref:uncharacterized protein LOC126213297 n=1 Tax=Schistocerca nitens TaxID=7011 RepID=UPI0021181BFF|nr:uncharacterized protein LOC126213297 [Schistocerca nitens]XP_049796930.1 uncharacterized protein LOC126213297 [Schistocerca nitens]
MGDREERQDLLVRDGSHEYDATSGAGAVGPAGYCSDDDEYDADGGGVTLSPAREAAEVAALALMLALSSAVAVVLLPLYLDTVASVGDAYTALLFTTIGSSAVLLPVAWVAGGVRVGGYGSAGIAGYAPPSVRFRLRLQPRRRWLVPLRDGSLLAVAGFLTLSALQEKRVPCHAQDPLKGLIMVVAIVHYFFFSHRVVCLRQLFLSTGAAVGLFVACDYALCDGYRCRGWERDGGREQDEGPPLGRGLRAAWLVAYLTGLTVWTLVAGALSEGGERPSTPGAALLHAGRLHATALPLTLFLFVLELVPGIAGAAVRAAPSLWGAQWAGLAAHFSHGGVAGTAWPWLVAYCSAAACSALLLRRLRVSSVLVLGAACGGVPLASLWWSLFRVRYNGKPPLGFGLVEWHPNLATGEAISALLGLPLVAAATVLALRAHLSARKGTAREPDACGGGAATRAAATGTARLCSPDSSS